MPYGMNNYGYRGFNPAYGQNSGSMSGMGYGFYGQGSRGYNAAGSGGQRQSRQYQGQWPNRPVNNPQSQRPPMSQPYRQGMPPMEQPVQPSAGEQQNNPQGRQITQAEKEMGIHYEPISSMFGGQNSPVDQAGQFPDAFPPAPAESITQTPQTNTVPDSLTATLVSWIQNERNGALFYEHLAAVSGDSDRRRLLHDIADTSRRHSQLFNTIYKERKGTGYEVRETGVETGVGFREGLRWAIREESKAVKELADLAEKPELDGVYRSLNAALCRKLSDLALLSSLAVM